jgi:hypothetical protein
MIYETMEINEVCPVGYESLLCPWLYFKHKGNYKLFSGQLHNGSHVLMHIMYNNEN